MASAKNSICARRLALSEKNLRERRKKEKNFKSPNEILWVKEEVKAAMENGIPVKIEGNYYNQKNIGEIPLLREEEYYMKDYIGDDSGKIKEIVFDKINVPK